MQRGVHEAAPNANVISWLYVPYGDWDMRIRQAGVVGRYAYVDEPLSEYRRHLSLIHI